jgi:hypothetical protein
MLLLLMLLHRARAGNNTTHAEAAKAPVRHGVRGLLTDGGTLLRSLAGLVADG